jgi:hypothetical protein
VVNPILRVASLRPVTDGSTDVIFNIVLTGNSFWHLRFFVCSLIDQSDAQFRLVTNACTPDSRSEISAFAGRHRERVVEVLEVSDSAMIAHGVALDRVRALRDDGDRFCFVDSDIKARRPFLDDFREILSRVDAVTSGKEVWTDDNVLPDGSVGVGGRHFYDEAGFTFGSPHFAMYQRDALEDTLARWGIGLGSAGPELSDAARTLMAEAGHRYRIYDTGKIANILFQLDGHTLRHFDHPDLIHIGGLSHFISPPDPGAPGGEVETPSWARHDSMVVRLETARYTAAVLRSSIERRPVPPEPEGAAPASRARFELVRSEMTDLVERYRDC